MAAALFTAAARRHVGRLRRALAGEANRLDGRIREHLQTAGWNGPQIRALLAVTPMACARASSVARFIGQVQYQGRRLAKLNVSLEATLEALDQCGRLVDRALEGRFGPAREQLHLATRLVLDQAFYQVREAESRALLALSRAEVEAGDLDDLLRRLVQVLVETFEATAGWLVVMEPGIQRRPVRARAFEAVGPYGSVWSVPFGRSAVLQIAFSKPYPWLPREEALLTAAAVHGQEALERALLEGQVRRLEMQARHAEEEERRRIGRELHDEAGQALMLLRLELEMLERSAPADLRPRLAEARELAGRTAVELRRIVAALSPAVLERLGLEAALRQLVSRFQKAHSARVRLRVRLGRRALPRPVEEVIYRVSQESLQNIAQHSQADHVNLHLHAADKRIELSVRDDGAGFCADQASGKPNGFGLRGMRERAALLGGTLAIASQPGKGTRIRLELPLAAAPVVSNGKDSRSIN